MHNNYFLYDNPYFYTLFPEYQPINYFYNYNQHNRNLNFNHMNNLPMSLQDYGGQPFVVNIENASEQNANFRTALWTGQHLQVTLMSIDVGSDIGLEVHPNTDQFLRIEEGQGIVMMGKSRDKLDFQARVYDDFAIMVPAGMWHNIINTGNKPLKLYSIYAPPEHPYGTVHKTKRDAMAKERSWFY